jgi:hypothetical protein
VDKLVIQQVTKKLRSLLPPTNSYQLDGQSVTTSGLQKVFAEAKIQRAWEPGNINPYLPDCHLAHCDLQSVRPDRPRADSQRVFFSRSPHRNMEEEKGQQFTMHGISVGITLAVCNFRAMEI